MYPKKNDATAVIVFPTFYPSPLAIAEHSFEILEAISVGLFLS
jgi:hypothetical protein